MIIEVLLAPAAVNKIRIKCWYAHFKRGRKKTNDAEHSEVPSLLNKTASS